MPSPHARSTYLRRRVVAATLLVTAAGSIAACSRSRSNEDTPLAADLRHDLELASTTGIELAGAGRGGVRVVSAIERGERAVPVRASRALAPKATGRKRRAPSPRANEPAPSPAPELKEAATVVAAAGPENENPAPATEPAPEPAVVASPEPAPSGAGDVGRGGRGGGLGTAIGTVVGVVIRGAVVGGVDHCDERPRRGRRSGVGGVISGMPLPLPGGVSGRFPQTAGTFPRY